MWTFKTYEIQSMKTILTTGFSFLIIVISIGQDIITKKDGTKIYGEVLGEDSTQVYILTLVNSVESEEGVLKSRIAQIDYGFSETAVARNKNLFGLLHIENSVWGNRYYQGNNRIYKSDFKNTLRRFPAIYSTYQKSITFEAFGGIIGFVGGILIGNVIGELIIDRNSDFKKNKFFIGSGLALISIPLNSAARNNQKKAISNYNDMITSKKSFGFQEEVRFSINGLGVYIDF